MKTIKECVNWVDTMLQTQPPIDDRVVLNAIKHHLCTLSHSMSGLTMEQYYEDSCDYLDNGVYDSCNLCYRYDACKDVFDNTIAAPESL